jgi:hypothetical protein
MADLPEKPLGEILGRALEVREEVAQAIKPPDYTTQSLSELAKHDTVDAYVAARRRQGGRG